MVKLWMLKCLDNVTGYVISMGWLEVNMLTSHHSTHAMHKVYLMYNQGEFSALHFLCNQIFGGRGDEVAATEPGRKG